MKVSYNLLKKYINIQDIDINKLSVQIAEHCFEVEKIEEVRESKYDFSNVFAAKVITKDKHPNADRLKVVSLDLGEKGIINPVVCGADNFVPGDIVALALPGAFIPQNIHSDAHESFTLGSAVIRGIQSQGMICSGFELGINPVPEDKPEIIILPKNVKQGTDLKEYYESKSKVLDYLIEVSLPANRPDLHSHIGIAREVSGMLDAAKPTSLLKKVQAEMDVPKIKILTDKQSHRQLALSISTSKSKGYFAARLKVKVGKTHSDILDTLKTLGYSGVNNVVDITNFVMCNVGQPMHAYDAQTINGKISIKEATGNEHVEALDAKSYKLVKGAITITDDKGVLGIGGIIGGMHSRITDNTNEIILESALFDGVTIRKTSKAIGLRTDASSLFEKGTAVEQTIYALNSAIELLKKYAEAELLEVNYALQNPSVLKQKDTLVKFEVEEINNILGSNVAESQVKKFLPRMGIKVTGSKKLTAKIPWYRQDISDAAGIADEVVRYMGMNESLTRQPLNVKRENLIHNQEENIWQIKDQAVNLGYTEIQTYSFLSKAEILDEKANPDEFIKISNPLSSETEYLRKNLFTSILKTVLLNAKHTESFKLFEVGFGYRGYLKEDMFLGLSIYNSQQQTELSLSQMKGDINTLLNSVGISDDISFSIVSGNSIKISSSKEKEIGTIRVIENKDLSASAIIASLFVDKIIKLRQPKKFINYGKFPTSSVDVSIIVDIDVKWELIDRIIRKASGGLLRSLDVIDAPYLYPKNSVPTFHKNMANSGKKNLLFRLIFGSEERTLSSSEISEIHAIITKELKNELNAEIR